MVTNTYAHGFDEDRKLIAHEMDSGFFSKVGGQEKEEIDNDAIEKLKYCFGSIRNCYRISSMQR